jgi:hypothetical protein
MQSRLRKRLGDTSQLGGICKVALKGGGEQGAAVEVRIGAGLSLAVSSSPALNHSVAGGTSSHEEAGAHTFLHGGAETHKPFPNLSRGF